MRPGPYPDAQQTLLLRAALGDGDVAREAWARFRAASGRIDDLDDDSFRLAPQLYRNLTASGISDATLTQLRGAYRYAWYRNHLLLHRAALCVRALQDAGIAVMALKGAAVTALYPGGLGTRPMNDVDLLVAPADVERAAVILRAEGLAETGHLPLPAARRTGHALEFRRDDGLAIDLHWHLMVQLGDDSGVWRRAHRGTVAGIELLVPAPTDQLLHTCVHGLGFWPAPVRWVADAVLITRSGATIDWKLLVAEARRRDVTVVMADALRFLSAQIGPVVPPTAIAALARSRASPTSRLAHRIAIGRTSLARGNAYVDYWDRYRRRERSDARRPTVMGYADFVTDCFGLPDRRALAGELLRRAVAIARRGVAAPKATRGGQARPQA
jgi:hypothetical protein